MTVSLADRYEGCLVGLAVGDALGAPLEFMGHEQIGIKLGWVTEMIGGGWQGLRPGETTDETGLVAALATSLAGSGRLDLVDVADRYRAWLRTTARDVDATTFAALQALDEGYDVASAAARAHELSTDQAAGNGTLVRAAPIALLFRDDARRRLRSAADEAGLTHLDARSVGGSVAVAAVLGRILAGETDRAAILDAAYDDIEEHAPDLPNVLPDAASRDPDTLRSTRSVLDTLELALVRWLADDDLESCLVRTVNRGGASSTAGALVGALSGAFRGASAIPRRWARTVQDRGSLARLARSLLERSESIGR